MHFMACECLSFLFDICKYYLKLFIFHLYLFRNIEEILAEKGEKIQKVTVGTEDLVTEKSIGSSSSNIELVIDEKSSNIFKAASRDENEK